MTSRGRPASITTTFCPSTEPSRIQPTSPDGTRNDFVRAPFLRKFPVRPRHGPGRRLFPFEAHKERRQILAHALRRPPVLKGIFLRKKRNRPQKDPFQDGRA